MTESGSECAASTRSGKLTPWACVGDIEMVSSFLGGEFSTGFLGDPISKSGLTALELAGLGVRPIGDFLRRY